jgi:hypothetical protein
VPAKLQVAGDAAGTLQRGGETFDDAANRTGNGAPDGIPMRSSFSSISSLEMPARKSSTPSTATTTSSSAPRTGIRSGMRSSGEIA